MNILFPIGSYYPSQQGGPCNSVHALAKGLVKAGVKVRVVTTNYDIPQNAGIPFDEWTEVEGVAVYYWRFPAHSTPATIDLQVLLKPRLFRGLLAETPCDVMHTTMLFTVMSHHAAAFARDNGIPVIWSPRGSMLPYIWAHGALKKKLFLSLLFVKRSLTGCHFHATSDEEATEIVKWMKNYTGEEVAERVCTIPNLVNEEVFVPGNDASPYPFRYILHLGRVHPKKKIENLIQALYQAKIDPAIKLVIAGWTGEVPEYTRMLKGLVEKLGLGDRVIFTEKRVEGKDKATLYRHAEVFVLPSESENFGMVVIESLAQGTPVIASNKTPWQVLEQRGAGYWVPNDPASLAQALERFFAQNETEKRVIKEKTLALAREYTDEALIAKYVRMYEEVMRK